MRSTVYNVPTTAEMLKQTSVPFALAISPFARLHEDEVCVIFFSLFQVLIRGEGGGDVSLVA